MATSIIPYPTNDINSLQVLPAAGGKFDIYWKYEPVGTLPTKFKIYNITGIPVLLGSVPCSGPRGYYRAGMFHYRTAVSYAHNSTQIFKVNPVRTENEIDYEKESEFDDTGVADSQPPSITTPIIITEMIQ